MTDFNKVFVDTSPIVYYLENNEIYHSTMKKFWKEYENCDYVTSAVTVTEYKFFKTMDALQLATACLSGCDLFLTNDKQLKQFKELKCITVEDLDSINGKQNVNYS